LEQAETVKEQMKEPGTRLVMRRSEDPAAVRKGGDNPQAATEAQTSAVSATPVRFVKGRLTSVDCSAAPQALLTVVFGSRILKMHIRDSKHVVLIGADEFSCEWQNKAVAVNYRERQNGEGDVVSLEVQ